MSLLVLEKDLACFMQVLRMNDLAYCRRNCPGTLISDDTKASRGIHGIKSEVIVTSGQQPKRYQHLILEFQIMRDLLHKTKVVGHADNNLAKKSEDYIQQQHIYKERIELSLSKTGMNQKLSIEVMGEVIASLMWLKHRGDEYLTQGFYSNAYMCYSSACILEKNWLKIAPPPLDVRFWTFDSCIFVTFVVALQYNMAIAEIAGGLDLGSTHFSRMSIYTCYGMLGILSGGGTFLVDERYAELSIAAHIYEILTELPDNVYHLTSIEEIWEAYYDIDDHSDLSSGLGLLYQTVKRLNNVGHTPTSHPESLAELKAAAARGFAGVSPLKWAMTENKVPKPLQELVKFLPRAQLLPGGTVENPGSYSFEIPIFRQPTDEQRLNGEEHPRYIM
jgi:hypothetical protein